MTGVACVLLHVIWSDQNFFQIISEIFIKFIRLCCITNVFTTTKSVVTIFSCFYKHQISLFLFKFLIWLEVKFLSYSTWNAIETVSLLAHMCNKKELEFFSFAWISWLTMHILIPKKWSVSPKQMHISA